MKQSRPALFDVVTIGGATRDIFVQSKHFSEKRSSTAPDGLEALIPLGAKIPVDSITFETGGGATNAAVTFANFGMKTACIARIGTDTSGQHVMQELKAAGVDVSMFEMDAKEHTAQSIILLAGAGHRAILTVRGASSFLEKNKIDWKKLSTNWIYLTSVAGSKKLLGEIFSYAKRTLTHVAWNPGEKEISLGLKALMPQLLQTDVLIMNLEEAAELADCAPRKLDCILKTLGTLPRMALVVTDGMHGAYAHTRGTTWHAPALKGKVVNTTGAGDAFGSAFISSLARTGDLEVALRAGTVNAFGVVTHMGAKAGILAHAPTSAQLARVRITA